MRLRSGLADFLGAQFGLMNNLRTGNIVSISEAHYIRIGTRFSLPCFIQPSETSPAGSLTAYWLYYALADSGHCYMHGYPAAVWDGPQDLRARKIPQNSIAGHNVWIFKCYSHPTVLLV